MVLLTVVSTQLSLSQKASCNFRFLPSPCLSTTNFHTYNIIQMENVCSWVPQQISNTIQWRHSGKQFDAELRSLGNIIPLHIPSSWITCQSLAGSFALQRIYPTLCLPIPFERQTFRVQRSFVWKGVFVSYRAKKTYKLVFMWNFASAMLVFFCNCNIIWILCFSGALIVLNLRWS